MNEGATHTYRLITGPARVPEPQKMKLLVVTNLFPSSKEPGRGIFNLQQVRHLADLSDLRVVAPLPWAPPLDFLRRKHVHSLAPVKEVIEGLEVTHPRYLVVPKIARCLQGICLFLRLVFAILGIRKRFKFDAILATWAYPDGFAVSLLGIFVRKAVIIKVHGSDINEYTRKFLLRRLILFGLRRAARVIAVSQALKKRLIEIGVPAEKIELIYNGVDAHLFFPMNRTAARMKLGLPASAKIILFVGNLVPVKGIEYLLEAFQQVAHQIRDDLLLILMGDGPLGQGLFRKAEELKIEKNVAFIGQRPHGEIPLWMGACDLLCLPSLNEGVPNVILEALACGRPVVASNVGGIPEMVKDEGLGLLVTPGHSVELAQALMTVLNKSWDGGHIRQNAPLSSWPDSASAIHNEVEKVLLETPKPRVRHAVKAMLPALIPKGLVAWRGRRGSKFLALTFDDGPDADFTPRVLKILRHYQVPATFFLLGQQAEKHSLLVKEIVAQGHAIGNHSYAHYVYPSGELLGFRGEIKRTALILDNLGVNSYRMFRPPRLRLKLLHFLYCVLSGKRVVFASLDSEDYRKDSAALIKARVLGRVKGGDIVLFHDDNRHTLEALPEIIEVLKKKGFRFSTVPALLKEQ